MNNKEEFIDLENKFLNNYKELNNYIDYFKKILELLKTKPDVRVIELNLSRVIPKSAKLSTFSFILSINSREYLFFLKFESDVSLEDDELNEYKSIFRENLNQLGIIITWNNLQLSSIILYEEDIYAPNLMIQEHLMNNLLTLEDLLNKIAIKQYKLHEVIDIPKKNLKKKGVLNVVEEFKNQIYSSYDDYKSRKFSKQKNQIIQSISNDTIESIINTFSKYISDELNRKDLKKFIIEISNKGD